MELDTLIARLRDWAEIIECSSDNALMQMSCDRSDFVKDLRKAAEVIKLQRECIVEESNERFRRGLDSVL